MEQMKIEYFQPDLSSNTQTFFKTLVEIYFPASRGSFPGVY